jgi:hypothetical protein
MWRNQGDGLVNTQGPIKSGSAVVKVLAATGGDESGGLVVAVWPVVGVAVGGGLADIVDGLVSGCPGVIGTTTGADPDRDNGESRGVDDGTEDAVRDEGRTKGERAVGNGSTKKKGEIGGVIQGDESLSGPVVVGPVAHGNGNRDAPGVGAAGDNSVVGTPDEQGTLDGASAVRRGLDADGGCSADGALTRAPNAAVVGTSDTDGVVVDAEDGRAMMLGHWMRRSTTWKSSSMLGLRVRLSASVEVRGMALPFSTVGRMGKLTLSMRLLTELLLSMGRGRMELPLSKRVCCCRRDASVVVDGTDGVVSNGDADGEEMTMDALVGALARNMVWVRTESCCTLKTTPITKLRISGHTPHKDC